MSRSLRIWIQVLCLVLFGHWWHALAMPYEAAHAAHEAATPSHEVHTLHVAHDAAHDANCCDGPDTSFVADASQPTPQASNTSHTTCGGAHVCCTLQPTPLITQHLLLTPSLSGARRAHEPQLALQNLADRMFKPPKTAPSI